MFFYVRNRRYNPDARRFYVPQTSCVFKGSTTVSNWKNNAEQLFSSKSADMWDAINAAKYFVSQKCGYEITFVGHSKGGGEATGAAIATNRSAILFNPAVLNAKDYGLSTDGYDTRKILPFIVDGESLNNIYVSISKDHYYIGEIRYLEAPGEEVTYYNSMDNAFHRFEREYSAKNKHSMEVVKLSLEASAYGLVYK